MLVMLRTESMEAWKSNAYHLCFQVKKLTLRLCSSAKWCICLPGVPEVRWSSLMKRSWETPSSWTLTGWPRQTWNILFWNSMKMHQGFSRTENGCHVCLFRRGLVSVCWVQAAANIFNCPRVVQGSVALARQMELRGGSEQHSVSFMSVFSNLGTCAMRSMQFTECSWLLANSQPWTGVFWNVASCMWICWSNTSGNHPGLLSIFQRWSTFCCGLTCSFPPRKRTDRMSCPILEDVLLGQESGLSSESPPASL